MVKMHTNSLQHQDMEMKLHALLFALLPLD